MQYLLALWVALAAGIPALAGADRGQMESLKAASDPVLNTDPHAAFWQQAHAVYALSDKSGKPLLRYRTEIRSRWTAANIYFLFVCPYEKLNLKPSPNTKVETQGLWNWDVAEVFIGSDFQHIWRYKEFEVSPQAEWTDLDIDLKTPHHEQGWTWNSGFEVAARINGKTKTWYAGLRIPFAAIAEHPPGAGDKFRINLYRSQGPPSDLRQIMWQPTMSDSFHVPERFGILKLIEQNSGQKP
jgi:hypothetical protein